MASLEASRERTPSYFTRDLTVLIDVGDNNAVKPEILIDSIEMHCGKDDVVAACVPKSGNMYEVTLKSENCMEYLREGVEVCGKQYECQELVSKFKIVSIMNLSCYVTDEEIQTRFSAIDVEIVSEIKRHCYRGTTIADGTRIMKVKLPANMVSLPYSMKFYSTEKDFAFYRVIHNDQKKVCSKCFSVDHTYKECPSYVCYHCDEQGHVKRNCPYPFCSSCNNIKSRCKCEPARQSGFTFNNGFKRKNDDESSHGGKRPYEEVGPEGPPHIDEPTPQSKIDENDNDVNMNFESENKKDEQTEGESKNENDMDTLNDNSTIDGDEFQDCENDNTDINESRIDEVHVDSQCESDGFSMGDSNSSTQGENIGSQSKSSGRQKGRKKKKKDLSNKVKENSQDGQT